MASFSTIFVACFMLSFLAGSIHGQLMLNDSVNPLKENYYDATCPTLVNDVYSVMYETIITNGDYRKAACLLRLFFHDCFPDGCDGSILLGKDVIGETEQSASPNANTLCGLEIMNQIKSKMDPNCTKAVSCADILAVATREGVKLAGGPSWKVLLGRKDTKISSLTAETLPSPSSSLTELMAKFKPKGFDETDVTALSGAHTIGMCHCKNIGGRLSDSNINDTYKAELSKNCATSGENLVQLDKRSPNYFNNDFYVNLLYREGLLHSDQVLYNNGSQDALVQKYAADQKLFFADFANAMQKLGNLLMLSSQALGEVRLDCTKVNPM